VDTTARSTDRVVWRRRKLLLPSSSALGTAEDGAVT
jgi:hypothetical protein